MKIQTHFSSFLTQRTYSCSNSVAISSLVLELLKKCRVRYRAGHPVEIESVLKPSARWPIDGWIYLRCIDSCFSRLKSGFIQICLQCGRKVNTRAALRVTWCVTETAPADWPVTKVTQNQQWCIDAIVRPTDVKCLVRRTERPLCYHQQQRKSTWKFYALNERIMGKSRCSMCFCATTPEVPNSFR